MLSFPFKKTNKVDLASPIKQYIRSTYGKKSVSQVQAKLDEINTLRMGVSNIRFNSTDTQIEESLKRYIAELNIIKSRFPIGPHTIRLIFTWFGAFNEKSKHNVGDINYEKACILFNLAALYTQKACSQNRATTEGLKIACQQFQIAAGIFSFCQNDAMSHVVEETSPEMSNDFLNLSINLCLAQAQECFLEKAILDKMKPKTISLLANQCAFYYENAVDKLNSFNSKSLPRSWIAHVKIRKNYYESMTLNIMAKDIKAKDEYGIHVAVLRRANTLLEEAIKLAKSNSKEQGDFNSSKLQPLFEEIKPVYEESENDNQVIYHEAVPEELPDFPKKSIVKATAFSIDSTEDPFGVLIPAEVRRGAEKFNEKADNYIDNESAQCKKMNNMMKEGLISMNLPAAVDSMDSSGGIPEAVATKIAKVQSENGLQSIYDVKETVVELANQNTKIIQAALKDLYEEEQEDDELRRKYGAKWTRGSSREYNGELQRRGFAFRTKVEQAASADNIINNKLQQNFEVLEKLTWSVQQLSGWIPSNQTVLAPELQAAVDQLKIDISKVDELIKTREDIIGEMVSKKESMDIVGKLLGSGGNHDKVFESCLAEFEPIRKKLEASGNTQVEIMSAIASSNEKFVHLRGTEGGAMSITREKAVREIDNAVSMFYEIKTNLKEGTQFYTKLQTELGNYSSLVHQYIMNRRKEAGSMVASMGGSLSGQYANPNQPTNAGSTGSGSLYGNVGTQPSNNMYGQSATNQTQYVPPAAYSGQYQPQGSNSDLYSNPSGGSNPYSGGGNPYGN